MAETSDPVRIEWNSEDLARIDKMLSGLSNEVRNVLIQKALVKGGKIVKDSAGIKAPVRRGKLRDSLVVRSPKENNALVARVTFYRTKARPGGFYAHLVEFGHRVVIRAGRKLIEKGHVPARPFLRPALEENVNEVISAIAGEVKTRVEKIKA